MLLSLLSVFVFCCYFFQVTKNVQESVFYSFRGKIRESNPPGQEHNVYWKDNIFLCTIFVRNIFVAYLLNESNN